LPARPPLSLPLSRLTSKGVQLGADLLFAGRRVLPCASLGVNLAVAIEAVLPRLEPYLVGANERDAYNEGMLAAREMADVLAPLLAAGAIKGEAVKRAAGAINRLNLARYNLECVLGENKVLVPGHASWQAAAGARFREMGITEPEIEEHGVKEPEAKELSAKEVGQ
jgi:hypothetical protein